MPTTKQRKPAKTLKKAMTQKTWYCGRCGAKISVEAIEKAPKGTVPEWKIRKCPSCKRASTVFDFVPSEENVKKFLKAQDVKNGMEKFADEEAEKGGIGGHGRRAAGDQGSIPDVTNMSDKDFEKLTFKVKTGKFKPR